MTDIKQAVGSNLGVGSNEASVNLSPFQVQYNQNLQDKATGQVLGAAGKVIDVVGKATGNILPDFKISENLERLGGQLVKPAYAAEKSSGDLVTALMSKGYSYNDAVNAANNDSSGNLRNEYLGGGGSGDSGGNGGEKQADPEGDAKAKYREITGEDPTADLLEKWKKSGQDLTRLAEENARLDMENADREYKATMDALGLQKGYIKSSAEKQRGRWNERETALKGEADVQSEKDLAKVEKEKESYEGEYEGDKSTLAQNWKDLSRYTQSLQRASGRQDSSFGNFAETKQLMDFNKGLRVLATKHSDVLGEFATAVTDTLDYYKQQKSEITRSVSDSLAKIDDWEQAQIVSIQGQEGISLAKKLSDINNATKQANNLKMQIQQNIDNKISTLDTWLLQTKVNFQDQVALLAKSQSGASSSKDQAAALSTYLKNMKSSLDLGMSSYVTDPIVAGNVNKGEYLYDATTGKYIPVKGGTGKQYEQEKESGLNLAKSVLNNAIGDL